jgi:uncharacterized SAM-binding protein YcdF (DUF218 family)
MLTVSHLGINDLFGVSGIESVPIATAIGFLAGAAGFGRGVRLTGGALLLLFLAVGWLPPIGRLAHGTIRRDPVPTSPVDAIVVLSASVTADGDLNPPGADRLIAGLYLYRQGLAPRIIVSRVANPTWHIRAKFSDEDQHRLSVMTGVKPEMVILDSVGTTRAEAVRASEVAKQNGWHRIILVTSPVHSRRACATFEKVGFEVSCQPSRDRTAAVYDQQTPGDRVRAFAQWTYEAVGTLVYRARKWI